MLLLLWSMLVLTEYALTYEIQVIKGKDNSLKGKRNHFELAERWSYGGFELPRVRLRNMHEANPEEINFGSS